MTQLVPSNQHVLVTCPLPFWSTFFLPGPSFSRFPGAFPAQWLLQCALSVGNNVRSTAKSTAGASSLPGAALADSSCRVEPQAERHLPPETGSCRRGLPADEWGTHVPRWLLSTPGSHPAPSRCTFSESCSHRFHLAGICPDSRVGAGVTAGLSACVHAPLHCLAPVGEYGVDSGGGHPEWAAPSADVLNGRMSFNFLRKCALVR